MNFSISLRRAVSSALAFAFAAALSTGMALAATKPLPTGKVNLNAASLEQLSTLPGVGPKLAARIVEYRAKSGQFKSVQELMKVKGIGERSFEKMLPFLTTDAASAGKPASAAAAPTTPGAPTSGKPATN